MSELHFSSYSFSVFYLCFSPSLQTGKNKGMDITLNF